MQIDRPTTYMRCTLGLLIILATAVLVLASPAAAGAITIGTGTAESCTDTALYQAVARARAIGGATIRFNCGSSPVTIPLTRETLVIPNNTKINGGDLVALTLGRPCLFVGLIGGPLLTIDPDSTVVLANLTLGNSGNDCPALVNWGTLAFNSGMLVRNLGGGIENRGTMSVNDGTFVGSGSSAFGPQVLYNVGTLTVTNSRFARNGASGIFNAGTATVSRSTFSGNHNIGGGGGIWNGGTLTVRDSFFFINSSGGIFNMGGMLTVSTSVFYGDGEQQSAITNEGGTAEVHRSLFQENGSFFVLGGAIYNSGTLTVTDSTISRNTAAEGGGGIYTCCGGTLTLESSVVTGNTPNDIVP